MNARDPRHLLLLAGTLAAVFAIPAATPIQAQTPSDAAARCAGLSGLARANLTFAKAELVEAGPAPGPPGARRTNLPTHCLVQGTINPRVGVGGREFGIGFEVRLPLEWSGRFMFQGGGGLDGVLGAAIGNVPNSTGAPALARGFAVVSTDAGHRGSMVDASFGLDQQARVDFAYNGLSEVTREAKALIARFYGGAPRKSYFVGCSNGGRQALMASQRLPLEFDGIVAGDPAMSFSRIALGEVWNMQVVARIAPKDEAGRPIYAKAFSPADLSLVRQAVLNQCDALDGLGDGMINDWRSCGFRPSQLTCTAGKTDQCLTAGQVSVLEDLMSGPKGAAGNHIYGPFTFDTGIASSAWRGMRLGTSETGVPNSADSSLGLGQFRFLQLTPPDQDWDPLAPYDLADLLRRIRYQGGIGDADSPFLSTFANSGKMIVYNGMSDQGMATPHLVRWYEEMVAATGDAGRDAVRFFGVPGMLHCGGGEATDRFEMLDAIVAWVEEGRAPDRIIATGDAFPGISRPLCPYPLVARYDGGNPASAGSFSCRS